MDRALVISDAPKAMKFFKDFLSANGYDKIKLASTAEEGRQAMEEFSPDICVINAPIGNASAEELSEELASDISCQVILFVKDDYFEDIAGHVQKAGVICLVKPISKSMFFSALDFAEAADSRMKKADAEIKRLERKLSEVRIVDHAKSILINQKNMTEAEAHRYIEKTAMDRRVPRGQVAEEIIDYYTD
ncbi:MAG: ANTAR domain-containing protein [bacterium LCO1.1]|uniref:Stage 0 sporulation protein A homolog n=1 Tax=Candidatus Weimeria bifida TaxID=2599074 RepID=A0A6N7IZ27_9FIRM|nr:ANTAR domain-containing protein [Candidatus Weimeria bifida]